MWEIIKKLLNVVLAYRYEEAKGKTVWRSKRFWCPLIAAVGCISAKYVGVEISADEQAAIITVVAVVIGLVSKGRVGFYEEK